MPNFRKSLYWKLCVVFITLFYCSTLLILSSIYYSWNKFGNRAEQLVHWNLAAHMARALSPYTENTIDYYGLLDAAHELVDAHPNAHAMFLTETGEVIDLLPRNYLLSQTRVPISPILRFLESNEYAPLYALDPRHKDQRSIFSVAPIQIGSERGYLYVLLNSRTSDLLMELGAVDSAAQQFIVALFAALLGTSLLGVLIFRRITNRFYLLSDTVNSFKKGDFSPRVELAGEDEIAQLGDVINGMAETIVENIDELEKKDRLRRELSANIAHDLRTPIASLSGYAETVLCNREVMTQEELERFLSGILTNAQSLNSLIGQLFELSKLEAKEVLPKPREIKLQEIGSRAVDEHSHTCEQKGVKLVCDVDESIEAKLDPDMVDRVLTNLIANALRHTPEDGVIRISGERRNGKVLLSIEDTGEGIPAEDLPHLFDQFYRGDKARTREKGGAGLGLAISKRIVDLHGGDITVESELSKGTKFICEFPSIAS